MSIPIRIARLLANGSTDTSFDPGTGLDAAGHAVAVLPAGQVVVAGAFATARGTPRQCVAVFNANGTLNAADPDANATATALAVQANGAVLLAGTFNHCGPLTRTKLARLKEDLAVEPAYAPAVNLAIHAVANQKDGKTIIGGAFTSVGGETRNRLARLLNHEADSTLEVENSSRVTWRRGGAGQETARVTFELSTDGGGTWSSLGGTVARFGGGWEATGLTLSGDGHIRARAFPADTHSQGVLEEVVAFDFVPEIQVLHDGDSLTSGGELDLGSVQTATSVEHDFSIANSGLAALTLTGGTPITITGTHASQFTVVDSPVGSIAGRDSAAFRVRCSPTADGVKTATLEIESDDDDEGTFTVDLTFEAVPGPGSLDTAYQPVPNKNVLALATGAFGAFIGGDFTTVQGQNHGCFARLGTDGRPLPAGGAGANPAVTCVAFLPDGRFLIGGSFTTVDRVGALRLARLNANGTLDRTFKVLINGNVQALAPQPDGSVIVGGLFPSIVVNGVGHARKNLARITAAGTADSWNPGTNGVVHTLAVQGDGKVLVGGIFTSIASHARNSLARLNADGGLDDSFDAKLLHTGGTPIVQAVALEANGKVLIGGSYTSIHGAARAGLNRLHANGTLDEDFDQTVMDVRSILVQADGAILAGGYLNGSLGSGVTHLVRVTAAGAEDASFPVSVNSAVQGLALEPDGGVLVGGSFVLGGRLYNLVRLANGPATGSLKLVDGQIQWLRGGTAPEAAWVAFDLSQDGGATWSRLGLGTRIPGGWNFANPNLPVSGHIRAQAVLRSGYFNGSSGLDEEQLAFADQPAPDVTVEFPAGAVIADGGVLQFPATLPPPALGQAGQTSELTLTLFNPGNLDLTNIAVAVTGEWSVLSAPPATLRTGAAATLVLQFRPLGTGTRTGVLTLTSSVPAGKNPYTVNLRGSGIAKPAAVTLPATGVTSTGATLKGKVTANHDVAKAFFEYRLSTETAWTRAPAEEFSVSGFTAVAQDYALSGLTPARSYHYRMAAYNSVNTSADPVYGVINSFNTPA